MPEGLPIEPPLSEEEPSVANALSRQALRSERTRVALLTAAEKVFARDGFDAARIEDIAAEAGRSRGAFYANFESKTELFLALRATAIRRRARELRACLDSITGEEARHAAVVAYIIGQVADREGLLLEIEFKLFAVRHPDLLPGLAERHIQAATSINMEEFAGLIPDAEHDLPAMRRKSLSIEAILNGFALNAMFSPADLDRAALDALIPRLLGVILPPPGGPVVARPAVPNVTSDGRLGV